jgi:SRSO17 transposase
VYKRFLKNRKFENSMVILNTPIVKTSILLSQIRALDVNIQGVLSTQLNFTPLILSLTQKEDRKNLNVANSIGNLPIDLKEINSILDNNIEYSWVNYSIIVGMEYLTNSLKLFEDLKIRDNQIVYPITIYKVKKYSFEK